MPTSSSAYHLFLAIAAIVAFSCLPGAYAFGAGDIPDFAYLQDKAFRHGDLERILEHITRWAGGGGGHHGGGLLGLGAGLLAAAKGGAKFSRADVKRVYFGNWLRDYSQAMDITGLSKVAPDTIILALSFLSFLTFGYGTEEFQLTADRLGVYLPIEHIDNPKGYADGPKAPKEYYDKLRDRMDPVELEIDPATGMKNYIAHEGQSYRTSAIKIRERFREAIDLARRSGGKDSPDLFEAYRLLGTGLHTLEDYLAHSNWVEISLQKMGHSEVFAHVGDSARVAAPTGEQVPPIVTGTFGGADFMFSVLGEAGDKLSQTSLSDVTGRLDDAKSKGADGPSVIDILKTISRLAGKGDQKADESAAQAEQLKQNAEQKQQALSINPDDYTTEEAQKQLWDALVWRDGIMRHVETILEHIPGAQELIDQLFEAMAVYVSAIMEPFMTPIISQVTKAVADGSQLVISEDDQFRVFNEPDASDPSHSMLSKDHFDNLLNEPAGMIAKVVVEHTTNLIVKAWSDGNVDVEATINEILQALHHPYWAQDGSTIQTGMRQTLERWWESLDRNDRSTVLERLSKESVKDGKNKRIGADENTPMHSHTCGARQSNRRGGGGGGAGYGGAGGRNHGSQTQQTSRGGYGQEEHRGGGGGYGGSSTHGETAYDGRGAQHTEGGYGRHQETETSGYPRGGDNTAEQRGYGGGGGGGGRHGQSGGYGRQDDNEPSYGSRRHETEQQSGGYGSRHQETEESPYGSRRQHDPAAAEDSYGAGSHRADGGGGSRYGSARADGGGGPRYAGYDQQQQGQGAEGFDAQDAVHLAEETFKKLDLGKRFGL